MKFNMEKAWADFFNGQRWEWGEGRPTDLSVAARLYRRAALRGLAEAQHALGFLTATGQGVPQDEAIAAGWFRRAAEQGNCSAQHNLAVMYAEGRGVPQDDGLAVYWFYRAAAGGSQIAREWLAETRRSLRDRMAAEF